MGSEALAAAALIDRITSYVKAKFQLAGGVVRMITGDLAGFGEAREGVEHILDTANGIIQEFLPSTKWFGYLLGLAAEGTLLASSADPIGWYNATHRMDNRRTTTSRTAADFAEIAGSLLATPTTARKNSLTEEKLNTWHDQLKSAGMDGLKPVWSRFMKGFRAGSTIVAETTGPSPLRSGKIPTSILRRLDNLATKKSDPITGDPKSGRGIMALAAAALLFFRR